MPSQSDDTNSESAFGSVLQQMRNLTAPIREGLRATYDAAQQDVSDVRQRRLPRQAVRSLGDLALTYQNPAMGAYIPNIPTYFNPSMEVVKAQAQRFLRMGASPEAVRQYVRTMYESMTPEATSVVRQTGQLIPASQAVSPGSLWSALADLWQRALFSGSVAK